MLTFDIDAYPDSLVIAIEGPMTSYSFSYSAYFKSTTEIVFKLILNKQIIGFKEETITIKFSSLYFLSTKGAHLLKDNVETFIYPKQDIPVGVDQGGSVISNVLGMTLGIIILSNVFL
jgi:hypothetical protein